MNRIISIVLGIVMLGALLGACGEEEFAYIPAEKMHVGEEITSYSVHNVVKGDTVEYVVLNFYPEEVTQLQEVSYDESTGVFTFHNEQTAQYKLSWQFEVEHNYIEVQYTQNGMWYTVNYGATGNEAVITVNAGMGVRVRFRNAGNMYADGDEIRYYTSVKVVQFAIESAD